MVRLCYTRLYWVDGFDGDWMIGSRGVRRFMKQSTCDHLPKMYVSIFCQACQTGKMFCSKIFQIMEVKKLTSQIMDELGEVAVNSRFGLDFEAE